MVESEDIVLRAARDFSLTASASVAAAASFVTGFVSDGTRDVLDLAFPLEGRWNTVGARVCQSGGGIHVRIIANPDHESAEHIRTEIERILSLDIDGAGFLDVAARDNVIARLQRHHPGVRPVLLSSPYEVAARAIIGHRLFAKQAAAVTARIAEEYGIHVDFGSHVVHAFPAPDRLAELPLVKGLAAHKVDQLRTLGATVIDGRFASNRLRAMDFDQALAHLQQLPGIGPFSAELIMIRGVGDADVFPRTEKSLHRNMAAAYKLGGEPNIDALEQIANKWRPYRSWAGLLLRNFWNDEARDE